MTELYITYSCNYRNVSIFNTHGENNMEQGNYCNAMLGKFSCSLLIKQSMAGCYMLDIQST